MSPYRVSTEIYKCPCGSKHSGTLCEGYPVCPFAGKHVHLRCPRTEDNRVVYPDEEPDADV